MVAGLQLPGKHESLLAEMLFSQMLRVPQPQLKPLAYSTLMVRHPVPPVLCCHVSNLGKINIASIFQRVLHVFGKSNEEQHLAACNAACLQTYLASRVEQRVGITVR